MCLLGRAVEKLAGARMRSPAQTRLLLQLLEAAKCSVGRERIAAWRVGRCRALPAVARRAARAAIDEPAHLFSEALRERFDADDGAWRCGRWWWRLWNREGHRRGWRRSQRRRVCGRR